jgi:hypothetical protein
VKKQRGRRRCTKRRQAKRKKKQRQLKGRDVQQRGGGKAVPLSPLAISAIERESEAFQRKFGRKQGPNDPLFFDRNADTPQPVKEEELARGQEVLLTVLEKLGAHPAPCYAGRKCDFVVTTRSIHMIDDGQVEEWEAAIREWEELSGEEATEMFIDAQLMDQVVEVWCERAV